MATFRVLKNKNYTTMSNYHLKDKNLSLKGKGLLSVMLSLNEEWKYSVEGLVAILKENETAINSTLKELKDLNYLEVIKLMPNETKTGRIDYIYNIYETPKQEGEKQDLEFLGVEYLGVENMGVVSNNSNIYNNNSNNKILNNKNNNNKILNNNKEIEEVFDYWNSCDIIKHNNLTQDMINVLKKLLNEFDVEQLQECIEHYSEAYHSEYQYCKYKWNLLTFFKQKNAWLEFMEDGSKWNNYLRWKQENKPTSKPNTNMELDLDTKPDTINGNMPNLELRAERYFENLYHNNIDKYYTELEKLKAKDIKLAQYVIKQVENGGFDEL